MTSVFERLPYEVLSNITEYASESKKYLHQLQLTSKRCQPFAEKQLFKELIIAAYPTAKYQLFLQNPQRCSYVKSLRLDGVPATPLDYGFFERFCNIERVYYSYPFSINWQYLSETFTPERCKLKELPIRIAGTVGEQHYLKMLQGHSHTLERLALEGIDPAVMSLLSIKDGSRSFSLPRLKYLSLVWGGSALQELCGIIDKCPLLKVFRLDSRTMDRIIPWTPTAQHQGFMTRVILRSASTNIVDMCAYLTTKFPNVQEWETANYIPSNMYRSGDVYPFENYVKYLHLMMKSIKAELNILATQSSLQNVFDFLRVYGATTSISIDYKYPVPNGDSLEPFIMKLQQDVSIGPVAFTYSEETYGHSELLQAFGDRIQELKLLLPTRAVLGGGGDSDDDEEDFEDYEDLWHVDYMQKGGALAHALDHCSGLISLVYRAGTLKSFEFEGETNKSLRKLTLLCGTIEGKILGELSEIAPNITDLTIESGFDPRWRSGNKNQISIDMPKNSFDNLVLQDTSNLGWDYSILLQVTSSTTSKTRYYVQRCCQGKREALASVSWKQYDLYLLVPHTLITISCKSIKNLAYYHYFGRSLVAFQARLQ